MEPTFKAIETRYNGHRFRSRLEARYAVWFDEMGVQWEYEKEGYDLDGLLYLPDFWLPAVEFRRSGVPGVWVEIKGSKATDIENEKCNRLAEATQKPVILLEGLPGEYPDDGAYQFAPEYWDNCMRFMKCYSQKCQKVKVEFWEGNYCYCSLCKEQCDDNHLDILRANMIARSVRFEHDERRF